MRELLQNTLTALQSAKACLAETVPVSDHADVGAIIDCKKNVDEQIDQLTALLAPQGVVKAANGTNEERASITPYQLALLKEVLPEGIEVVNEGTEDLSIWDANNELQYPIGRWESAKKMVTLLICRAEEHGEIKGRTGVQQGLLNLLGVSHALGRLAGDQEVALDRLEQRIIDKMGTQRY